MFITLLLLWLGTTKANVRVQRMALRLGRRRRVDMPAAQYFPGTTLSWYCLVRDSI